MRALAEHPDHEAQCEAFEGIRGEHMNAWTVRDPLQARGTRIGDPLGQLVVENCRAAGGPSRRTSARRTRSSPTIPSWSAS